MKHGGFLLFLLRMAKLVDDKVRGILRSLVALLCRDDKCAFFISSVTS